MARSSAVGPLATDPTAIDFARILSRLEKIILAQDVEGKLQLRTSSLERSRVAANLEYARTLLLRLEHESSGMKLQSRKQDMQVYLLEKRNLIKRLAERLHYLGELDDSADLHDDAPGEDLLGEDTDEDEIERSALGTRNQLVDGKSIDAAASSDHSPSLPSVLVTETRSSLRSRHKSVDRPADTALTSSASIDSSTARSTEKLFSHNRGEQEDLTSSLLSMAQALKQSSQAFSSSLESEKDVLNRAGEGLDKNTTGMQAAEKRMGTLRRMTEGRGWWGRMLMYGWIAGLMMLALVIVGFLPKLRF